MKQKITFGAATMLNEDVFSTIVLVAALIYVLIYLHNNIILWILRICVLVGLRVIILWNLNIKSCKSVS